MTRIFTIAGIVWKERLRTKGLYVLFVLSAALMLGMLPMDVSGLDGSSRYLCDIGLLLAWLFSLVIAIATSSRQIPGEQSGGTIYSLLAKPVTRADVIVGKWLGAWTISSAATLVFYALVVLLTLARGGYISAVTLLQGVLAHIAAIGVISAIALAFSTRLNSDATASLTAVFTVASLVILPRVPNLFLYETNSVRRVFLMVVYHILPHFELFDMRRRIVHDWGPAEWPAFFLVLIYAAMFVAIFLIIAWLGFRNKRFPRDVCG